MPSLLVKRLELQDEIDVPPEIYNWFVPQNFAVTFYQRYTDPKKRDTDGLLTTHAQKSPQAQCHAMKNDIECY